MSAGDFGLQPADGFACVVHTFHEGRCLLCGQDRWANPAPRLPLRTKAEHALAERTYVLDPAMSDRLIAQADRFHACPTDILERWVAEGLDRLEADDPEVSRGPAP